MFRIMIFARGGQGAKIGAEIFAEAHLKSCQYVQSSPKFGIERRGAPIEAYIRLNERVINERGEIEKPDMIVVFDPTLINQKVFKNLKENGWILINAPNPKTFLEYLPAFPFGLATIDAYGIAVKYGIKAKEESIINIIMLGAMNALVNKIKLNSLLETINEKLPEKITLSQKAVEKNIAGATEADKLVKIWSEEEIKLFLKNNKLTEGNVKKYFGPEQPTEQCNGCQICIRMCPKAAIVLKNKKAVIDYTYCNNCLICLRECPQGAIKRAGGNNHE